MRFLSRGYISILLAVAIPVFFLGVKYVVERIKYNKERMLSHKDPDSKHVYKACAREAALAVAQNWNPGLTLSQQKDAILKIADAVYNAHPCHYKGAIGAAIPGLSATTDKNSEIEHYGSSLKTVEYVDQNKYVRRIHLSKASDNVLTWNPYVALWRAADMASNPENRASKFDE